MSEFVTLSIETVGDERMVRGFNRYVKLMKDFRPVFDDIRDDFQRREREIFAKQGDPVPFKKLSSVYEVWKEQHYPGRPIMVLRGRLYSAMVGNSKNTLNKQDKTSAEFGVTGLPYPRRHQLGRNMPQRKFVQVTDADQTRWARMIQEWSYRQLKDAVPAVSGLTR